MESPRSTKSGIRSELSTGSGISSESASVVNVTSLDFLLALNLMFFGVIIHLVLWSNGFLVLRHSSGENAFHQIVGTFSFSHREGHCLPDLYLVIGNGLLTQALANVLRNDKFPELLSLRRDFVLFHHN